MESRMREIRTYGLMRGPPHRKNRGGRLYSTSAKRRCIVYVVMFCASRDHKSWQGVASLRDAGANTYTPIYALCADAGQFAVSLHKSPVAPTKFFDEPFF